MIYEDLNFGFYEKVEVENAYDPNLIYDYRAYYDSRCINKYYVRRINFRAVPLFLQTSHFISNYIGYPTDGYSRLYIISVTIAVLLYLVIGLVALRRTLFLFGVNEFNTLIVISTFVFGTNLFYYSIGQVGMSHVYSFSMISVFVYQVSKYFQEFNTKHIIYGTFFLGLIILIRPINAIVILSIPFLSQNTNNLIEGSKSIFSDEKFCIIWCNCNVNIIYTVNNL